MRYPQKKDEKKVINEFKQDTNTVPPVFLGTNSTNNSGSLFRRNPSSSITLLPPPYQREYSLAAETALTFEPVDPSKFTSSTQIPEIQIPIPSEGVISSDEANVLLIKQERVKIRKTKIFLLRLAFGMITLLAIGKFLPIENEEPLIPEEFLESCEGDKAEISRFQIDRSGFHNESSPNTFEIIDLEINCFPLNSLTKINKDLLLGTDSIILNNVTFGLIQANALAEDIGITLKSLTIKDSNIGFFLDQDVIFTSMAIINSNLQYVSSELNALEVSFQELEEAAFYSWSTTLLTPFTKSRIQFSRFVNDNMLFNLLNNIEEEGPMEIVSLNDEVPLIQFNNNFITEVPSGFFGQQVFNFATNRVNITFSNENSLVNVARNAFTGNREVLVDLSFIGCQNLEVFPEAAQDLNLASLDLSFSGVTSFVGFNVSYFPNLESINLQDTAAFPNCGGLETFIRDFSIPDTIDIGTERIYYVCYSVSQQQQEYIQFSPKSFYCFEIIL
eukprot:maker-scaffold_38-snap-gene-1.15-mRNA-1 protein AED:0.03 eAED:0.03 QI:0/0/0.5/1/0/0/2/38/501